MPPTGPLVGQGDNCVVILARPGVMTPDEADVLALALVRGAERARRDVELRQDRDD